MIHKREKRVLKNIKFPSKYLSIREKYIDNGYDTDTFKTLEIKNIFKEINYKFTSNGNRFIIKREYENYIFRFDFICKKNITDSYIYFYEDKNLIDNGFDSLGYALNFSPYDKEKADKINTLGFGLNSLEDLKNYIKDLIELYDEFVDEYIKEIETKNI